MIYKDQRISKNAGEWYYNLSLVERTIFVTKIIQDIINFETIILKDLSTSDNCIRDIKEYITILLDPIFPWKIKNLPYDYSNEVDSNCPICNLALETDIIKIDNTNLHHKCLLKYIETEIDKNKSSEYWKKRYIYLIKPIRNFISFGDSYNKIDWKYYTSFII